MPTVYKVVSEIGYEGIDGAVRFFPTRPEAMREAHDLHNMACDVIVEKVKIITGPARVVACALLNREGFSAESTEIWRVN